MKRFIHITLISLLFVGTASCYNDADIRSQLDTLNNSTIASLKSQLNSLENKLSEMTSSINSALSTASNNSTEVQKLWEECDSIRNVISETRQWIETLLGGYYTQQEVNERLSTITDRVDKLEATLSRLSDRITYITRPFSIQFNDIDVGIVPGGSSSVDYTIQGATESTIVKALGQSGWSASVKQTSKENGTITVKAPETLENGEIIVLVYDGEYRTIMSTVNFVKGFVTPSINAIELDYVAGSTEVIVDANLQYTVNIPVEAQSWLSCSPSTRTARTDKLCFSYTENEASIRKATVSFSDMSGNTVSSIAFIQQGQTVSVSVNEPGTLAELLGDDYMEIKSLVISGMINGTDILVLRRMTKLKSLDLQDARIVSGGLSYGKYYGIDLYTTDDEIGKCMFENSPCTEIVLPRVLKKIGERAFHYAKIQSVRVRAGVYLENEVYQGCAVRKIVVEEGVEELNTTLFSECTSLTEVILPSSLKIIGGFYWCKSLRTITLPPALEEISIGAFQRSGLWEITIPSSVKKIGPSAFSWCDEMKEIHIKGLPTVLSFNSPCFQNLYDKATLFIPYGTKDGYFYTELGSFKTIIEE